MNAIRFTFQTLFVWLDFPPNIPFNLLNQMQNCIIKTKIENGPIENTIHWTRSFLISIFFFCFYNECNDFWND